MADPGRSLQKVTVNVLRETESPSTSVLLIYATKQRNTEGNNVGGCVEGFERKIISTYCVVGRLVFGGN